VKKQRSEHHRRVEVSILPRLFWHRTPVQIGQHMLSPSSNRSATKRVARHNQDVAIATPDFPMWRRISG
jgi:hypothetical protein